MCFVIIFSIKTLFFFVFALYSVFMNNIEHIVTRVIFTVTLLLLFCSFWETMIPKIPVCSVFPMLHRLIDNTEWCRKMKKAFVTPKKGFKVFSMVFVVNKSTRLIIFLVFVIYIFLTNDSMFFNLKYILLYFAHYISIYFVKISKLYFTIFCGLILRQD